MTQEQLIKELKQLAAENRRLAAKNPPKHAKRLLGKAQGYEHAAELAAGIDVVIK